MWSRIDEDDLLTSIVRTDAVEALPSNRRTLERRARFEAVSAPQKALRTLVTWSRSGAVIQMATQR